MNQYAAGFSSKTEQIRRLEQQFDTNVDYGLPSGEAKRRLRWNDSRKITKEKKRLWLQCFVHGCYNPLFFFLCTLCIFLFFIKEESWIPTGIVICLILFLKMNEAGKWCRFLKKKEELFQEKALVLRDGIYKKVDVLDVVQGDVMRIKKEQIVPVASCSICKPGRRYWRGDVFPEESGKVIAAENLFSFSNDEDEFGESIGETIVRDKDIFWQKKYELLFQEKIYIKKDLEEFDMVCLDDEYFPKKNRYHFNQLYQTLKEENIFMLFFTNIDKKEAFYIANQAGIVEESRSLIDKEQFTCYTEDIFEKQMESIQIYAGLSECQKADILLKWKEKGRRILFLTNYHSVIRQFIEREETEAVFGNYEENGRQGIIYYGMGYEENAKDADICFMEHWSKGIFKLIEFEKIWKKYTLYWRLFEEKAVEILCGVTVCLLLVFMFFKHTDTFHWMLWINAGVISGLLLGREILLAVLSRGFPHVLDKWSRGMERKKNRKMEEAVEEAAVAQEEERIK